MITETREVIAFKKGAIQLEDPFPSIRDAAQKFFKGTNQGKKLIQKSCSGQRKSLIDHEEFGQIYFRYKPKKKIKNENN